METILNLTYLYLLVILLALLVERIMEVIMAIWNLCELKFNGFRFWNRRARKLQDKFASRLLSRLSSKGLAGFSIRKRVRHYANIDQEVGLGKTIVFSSRAVRHVFVRTFAIIVTSAIGVVLCNVASINLIALIKASLEPNAIPLIDVLGPRIQLIISGLIVGLGAEPVHRLIKGLEDSRVWHEKRNRLNESIGG